MSAASPSVAVVLGARNLGAAITLDLLERGVQVAPVARTQADLDALAAKGAKPVAADASDPDALSAALAEVERELGPPDLFVNAASASHPPDDDTGFGGGRLADASLAGFEGWTAAVARQSFLFLRAAATSLEGREGTIVQVTGGSARRANAGRGLWAAGCGAVRTLTHAAAIELREDGTHVALLVLDGIIASPKTTEMTKDMAKEATLDQAEIAAAVHYLATQGRGMTHELQMTPAQDRWVP